MSTVEKDYVYAVCTVFQQMLISTDGQIAEESGEPAYVYVTLLCNVAGLYDPTSLSWPLPC